MAIATILPLPRTVFLDLNSNPLSGGLVFSYIPNTTTLKTTWQDAGETIPNSNPIILDGNGSCLLYGSGAYELLVQDSMGNLVYTGLTQDLYGLIVNGNNTFTGTNSFTGPVSLGSQATATTQSPGDTSTLVATDAFVAAALAAATPSLAVAPQGRLSLSSTAAVMTTDASAVSTIYYLPYVGQLVPIWNGTAFVTFPITAGLSLTLNSTFHPSTEVFDVYASVQAGVLTLSAMYWGSNTLRSNASGGYGGASDVTIVQVNGLWVNNAAITSGNSYNGTTSYAILQNQATYLGTFYTTGNGQTTVNFKPSAAAGGGNNVVGLWNAYNRTNLFSISRDSTASWTYGTNTWRKMDNNVNNRVSWVDGLQQTAVIATVETDADDLISSPAYYIGVNLDSTSATPNMYSVAQIQSGNNQTHPTRIENFLPQLGLHYIQAMELCSSGTATLNVSGASQSLTFTGQY